jgi:molybdate transport system ATP-binding protein
VEPERDMNGLDAHLMVERNDFQLDVALSIEPGETVALLGPNGAGKSTTVNALAGITPLTEGHIRFGGRTLDDVATQTFVPPEDRNIGIVFQDYLLFDHMTVRDNIMFGLTAGGRSRAEARTVAAGWIERLALGSFADRKPGQLSGGQAQRVALARALAPQPDMLLLDEPLAALDVGTRSELRRVLSDHLAEFDGPRLLITHDPTDAFLLADRIAVLEAGQLTQVGTSDDIRRRPMTAYVAAVAGTNLLTGFNDHGTLTLADHSHLLQTADTSINGPVLITIHPTAIALHRNQPSGSPRNAWETTVANVEPLGDTTRIVLDDPVPLGVDVTPGATAALDLRPGERVWASVKATEIQVTPSSHP